MPESYSFNQSNTKPIEGNEERPNDPDILARTQPDKYIWAIYLTLLLFSVIELYSASSREVVAGNVYAPILRHGMMLVAGTAIIYFLSRIPYQKFIVWIPIFVVGSIAMMVYVLFFGDYINGARRSFTLAGITIQPSEFLKLSAVMIIALVMSYTQLSKNEKTKNTGLILSALVVLTMGGLLFTQGLTNTLLLMSISIAMMIVGGTKMSKIGVVLLTYALIGGAGYFYKNSKVEEDGDFRGATWLSRIERFFDSTPKYELEINAKNRQEMYSYMAQANGGVLGVSPGNSRETSRLPLAFSDYIFAIVVEDLGFVGGLFVLILYISLIFRAGHIAAHCARAFPALLVMGCAMMIIMQALFHMAIVTGVFPVSGQPLPLISKGGTSILITSIAFGLMLSVSRFAVQSNKRQEVRDEINSLPEEVRAENPTQLK